jgi:MFS transporter, ACS family, tartrate transporter
MHTIQATSDTASRIDDLAGATVEDRTIRKAARRIMPLVFLGLVLSFLDRVNLGFAAVTMNRDLGLDQAVYGMIAGVFFIGYFLFEIPSNVILERVGARLWLARIMISWGLLTCVTAFAASALHLNVIRFLLGIAEAGYSPGVLFYLSLWFPRKHCARMFAIFMLAQPLGAIISAPLAAAFLSMDGILDLKGWQWLFLIEGLPAIALGFVFFRMLPPRPADAKWLAEDERAWLTGALDAERAAVEARGVHSLKTAFRNPRLLLVALGYGTFSSCFWCVVFFLPQIIKATGASATAATLLAALPYVAAGIVTFITGRIAARSHALEQWIFGFTSTAAVALAAMAYLGTSPWSLAAAVVAMGAVLGFLPFPWAIIPRFLTGRAAAGGFAFVNSSSALGGFLGPLAFGWVAQQSGSYSAGLWAFAGVAVISGTIFLVSRRVGEAR